MDTVRLAMVVACVRLGADPMDGWELIDQAAQRRLLGSRGWKRPAELAGAGPDAMARRWRQALDPLADPRSSPERLRPRPIHEIRSGLAARLDRDPEDREALYSLACQQHPDDFPRIAARVRAAGRREAHVVTDALGESGDPRAIGLLLPTLRAMDVDPGHGFAGRRAAATALGRLGLPEVGPALSAALEVEAADYEGRPGAGMGIQYPVRSVMLTALGEAGAMAQAPVLAAYLADLSGSAFGGFYLPAMDALWKLQGADVVVPLLAGTTVEAQHAAGLLLAMGRLDLLDAAPEPRRAELRSWLDAQGEPKGPAGS